MDKYFINKLKESTSIPDIFEVVKEVVWKTIKKSRAGLELGLVELENDFEAHYLPGSNIIIMNENILKKIQETTPRALVPYIFSTLLNSYLRSLGFEEKEVKKLAYKISCEIFGKRSVIAEIVKSTRRSLHFKDIPKTAEVKIVRDFDKSNIRYIG